MEVEKENEKHIIEDIEFFEEEKKIEEEKKKEEEEEEIIDFTMNQIQEIIDANNNKNQCGIKEENKIIKSITSFNILQNKEINKIPEEIISNPKIFMKKEKKKLIEKENYIHKNHMTNKILKEKLKNYQKLEKTIKNDSFIKDIEENEDLRLLIISNPLSYLFKNELEKVLEIQKKEYLKKLKNNSQYKYNYKSPFDLILGNNNIPHFLLNRPINPSEENSYEEEIEQESIEDFNEYSMSNDSAQ